MYLCELWVLHVRGLICYEIDELFDCTSACTWTFYSCFRCWNVYVGLIISFKEIIHERCQKVRRVKRRVESVFLSV